MRTFENKKTKENNKPTENRIWSDNRQGGRIITAALFWTFLYQSF